MNAFSAIRLVGGGVFFLLLLPWLAAPPAAIADAPPAIGQLEYFFNVDPGEGAGTILPFSETAFSFTAATTGLPPGTHTLYLRVRDEAGVWGPARTVTVNIEPSSPFENVAAWEASVGEPAPAGTGQVLPVEGTPGKRATFSGRVNLEHATHGTETVYLRVRDDAGTWGPAFPITVGVEVSGDGEVPAALQYAWLEAEAEPQWQTQTLDAVDGRDGTLTFDPGLAVAGRGLGTHYLAMRGLDSAGGAGSVFVVPAAIVPDSLTGQTAQPDRLVAYAQDGSGMIEGSRVERILGAPTSPLPTYSMVLPLDQAAPGPVEVVAYLRMVTGETSPHYLSAPVLVVLEGTNGYADWRAGGDRFTPEEQVDETISGPEADPDLDGVPNKAELAFGGDPREPSRDVLPVIEDDGGDLVLRFRQLVGGSGHRAYNYTANGVRYTVQYAYSLGGDWFEGGNEAFVVLSVEDNGDGTETVAVVPAPAVSAGREAVFLRLKVTLL